MTIPPHKPFYKARVDEACGHCEGGLGRSRLTWLHRVAPHRMVQRKGDERKELPLHTVPDAK